MSARGVVQRVGRAGAAGVLALVWCAALLLSPFRIGRLLRIVSIPRLREHGFRTTLTVIGIALGIAVLISVLIVNQSILRSVATTIDDVAGKTDLEVSAGASGFDGAVIDAVRVVPGVYKATVVLEQTVTNRDPRAAGERLLLLGVDFLNAEDQYFRTYGSAELGKIEADPIAFLNSPHNVILSRTVADRLGYRLHDKVPLQTPLGKQDFDIWGFVGDEGVGRAFGGAVAVMDYGAMQVAFARGSNVDRIDVAVAPGSDPASVARAVKAAVGPAFAVDRPERKNERVGKMLASLRSGLTLASLVALLVGMFLIYNTMGISVVQRRREIGTLRALGATRRDVVLLFTLEGTLLGIVGSSLGVVTGVALARLMLDGMEQTVSEMFFAMSHGELHVDGALVAGAFGAGLLATTLAAAFPAGAAARATPVETLRAGALVRDTPPPRRVVTSDLIAALLLALSALLLRVKPLGGVPVGAFAACLTLVLTASLLAPRLVQLVHATGRVLLGRGGAGVEARIANENLPRDIVRTSTTTAALMVGVAMATSFATFVGSFESSTIEWVNQTLPADLWITSAARLAGGGTSLPLANELLAPLSELPDVSRVERVRVDDLDYQGFPIKLVASDIAAAQPRIHLILLEGTEEEAIRKLLAGGVVVAENFSRRFGVHRGDHITLGTRSGVRTFEVAAVMVDYTSDSGVLMLDRPTYVEAWGDDRVDTYKLYLKPGADPEPTRRVINERFGDRYNLFVLTNREFREAVIDMLNQAFAVMHLLEGIAIVISVLGVVNALLANVLDRVRELGVLRAVGMLRAQIAKMVVIEGFLVGAIGVIGGIVLGLGLGHVLLAYINLAQTGWYLPYRPSWPSVAETALLVVAGATLSGWYPARYAARLVIADALEYE